MRHTKEPWFVEEYGGDYWIKISDSNKYLAKTSPYIDFEISEANAKRIVACVNACAGISNDDLDLKMRPVYSRRKVIAQRDKLLEGLREIFNDIATATDPRYIDVLGKMQKLIAKIKEFK